jgi:hypothetical protein
MHIYIYNYLYPLLHVACSDVLLSSMLKIILDLYKYTLWPEFDKI